MGRVNHKQASMTKCCLIFSLIVFVSMLIGGFILCFETLVPSINKAKPYKEGSCTVLDSYVTYQCDVNVGSCSSYNDQIFWYNSYGSGYFFYYYGGGYPDNGSYGDDSEGDDDGEDDGNDDDGEDDGGDDDDDDGGDSGGGDSGGGDGDVVIDKLMAGGSTSGGQYGVNSEIRQFRKAHQREIKEASRRLQSVADTFSSDSATCDYSTCYQGDQIVQYQDDSGNTINATVLGLWTSDTTWITDYVNSYTVNSSYSCYYNTDQTNLVMWFKPPPYDKSALAGTIILFSIALFALIICLVCCIKGREHLGYHHFKDHLHHSSNHSTQHGGYTVIQQQPTSIVYPQQPVGYYQYNSGVPTYNGVGGNNGVVPTAPNF